MGNYCAIEYRLSVVTVASEDGGSVLITVTTPTGSGLGELSVPIPLHVFSQMVTTLADSMPKSGA